ncbi:MAG: response regulator [Nitrospiraceae bacterium]|nr:response regulator [Nitrospiraceae bacterium]
MRPENVLFVDDNELLRSVMMRFFSKEFQHVKAVGTGNEAMKQIQEKFYHIVILDKKLPDIDGLDVLDYISGKSPHSRVVMITSSADEDIRQEALKRGAFEFFEKPFDIDKLKAALRGMRVFKSVQASIDEKHKGMIYNLSDSGMLVMTDAVFKCGATVDILLHVRDNREIPLKGRVVRTSDSSCIPPQFPSAEDGMKYAVGMQLVDPPSDYFSFVDSLML